MESEFKVGDLVRYKAGRGQSEGTIIEIGPFITIKTKTGKIVKRRPFLVVKAEEK